MTGATSEPQAVFEEALDVYRRGLHYEAHELWEELWIEEEDDDRRRFLQALIQVASAVHKLVHDVGPRGALSLLTRAQEKLAGLPEDYGGVRVDALRAGIERALAGAERKLTEGRKGFDSSLIPAIKGGPTPRP